MNYQIIETFSERVEKDGGDRIALLGHLAILMEHLSYHRAFLKSFRNNQDSPNTKSFFQDMEKVIQTIDSKYHLLNIKDLMPILIFFIEILQYGIKNIDIFTHVKNHYLQRVQNYFSQVKKDEEEQNFFNENLKRLGDEYDLRDPETQSLFLQGTGYEKDPIFFDINWIMNMLRVSVKFKAITEPILSRIIFLYNLDPKLIQISETLSEKVKFLIIIYSYVNTVRISPNSQKIMGMFMKDIIESEEKMNYKILINILRSISDFNFKKFEDSKTIIEFVEISISKVYLISHTLNQNDRYDIFLSIIKIVRNNHLANAQLYLQEFAKFIQLSPSIDKSQIKRLFELYYDLSEDEILPSFKKHIEYIIRYFRNDEPLLSLDAAIEPKINFVLKRDHVNFGCQLETHKFVASKNPNFKDELFILHLLKHFGMVKLF